jgi:glycosyltransferase involved in cell wall biosynthesis
MPSVAATFFAKRMKKPVILTQHNTYINYKNLLFRGLQSLADKTLGKYTLSNSNRVIAVSKKTREYVNSIAKDDKKTVVQYNGINLKRFKSKDKKSLIRIYKISLLFSA